MAEISDNSLINDRNIILLEKMSTNREVSKSLIESLGYKVHLARHIDEVFALISDQVSETLIIDIDLLSDLNSDCQSRLKNSTFRIIGISLSETTDQTANNLIDTILYRPVSLNNFSAALNSDERYIAYLDETYILSEMEIVGCDVVEDMLQIFNTQQGPTLRDIEAALASEDYSAIEKNAHKLAGLCGTLGLRSAHQKLAQVEAQARNQDQDVLRLNIDEFQNLLALSLSSLQKFISSYRQNETISL